MGAGATIPRGRNHAAGARSALLDLDESITAVHAVGVGLSRAGARPSTRRWR